MINIFTILIITYIINICLLKSIHHISLKESSVFDSCSAELAAYVTVSNTDLKQFGKDVESGVTTAKFMSTTKVLIQKKSGSSEVINHYTPTYATPVSPNKYSVVKLTSDYIAKKEGSAQDYTYEKACDKDISIGVCEKTIHIASKTVGGTTFYVDKCGVTADYTGDTAPTLGTVKYTHITAPKNSLLKSSITNVRMSRMIDNKISTTVINSEATKYCHINNINGYYMIFVGAFQEDVVKDKTGTDGNAPVVLSVAADIKYYNESSSGIEVVCGKKAETTEAPTGEVTTEATTEATTPGEPEDGFRNKRGLQSLKEGPTDVCPAEYAKFNIESDDTNHYFYVNSFYLGGKSTDKYSIPKSVADSVSSEDQWCFNGLEINKISIININIFIIIIVLLLSLI